MLTHRIVCRLAASHTLLVLLSVGGFATRRVKVFVLCEDSSVLPRVLIRGLDLVGASQDTYLCHLFSLHI